MKRFSWHHKGMDGDKDGDWVKATDAAAEIERLTRELAETVKHRDQLMKDAEMNREIIHIQSARIRELLMLLGMPHAPHIVKQN